MELRVIVYNDIFIINIMNDNYNDYDDFFQIYEQKESNRLKCSDYLRFTSDGYE